MRPRASEDYALVEGAWTAQDERPADRAGGGELRLAESPVTSVAAEVLATASSEARVSSIAVEAPVLVAAASVTRSSYNTVVALRDRGRQALERRACVVKDIASWSQGNPAPSEGNARSQGLRSGAPSCASASPARSA
jgi:hypothetical protein